MSKKTDKAPAAESDAAPKKRSKLKLAIFALVPLLLGGGGYAGWTMFLAGPAEEPHAAEAPEGGDHSPDHAPKKPDPIRVAAIRLEVASETSYTYSFALSELLKAQCGKVNVEALKAASEKEAENDGVLVNLSWQAATRRLTTITEKSCDYMRAEIIAADNKALALAQPAAAKGGHGEPAAGHGEPAGHGEAKGGSHGETKAASH